MVIARYPMSLERPVRIKKAFPLPDCEGALPRILDTGCV
jgi:hypothetical protein